MILHDQLFVESVLPSDASALLLLDAGLPSAGATLAGAPREVRKPGSMDSAPLYRSGV